jgi:cysteine-rich repeat protein
VNASSKNYRLAVSLTGALLVSAALAAPPATAQISRDQQLCINSMEKDFTLIDKQVGRQVASCLKNHAKGRPLSPLPFIDTVVECVLDDPRGKIGFASQRAMANFTRRCTPPLPGFGPTDVFALGNAGERAAHTLARDVWTQDLDPNLVLESVDKRAATCQQKAWKAATKCEQARLKEFSLCTRKGLRGAAVPGLIDSGADLQNRCLGVGTNPQPDPRKKVARACSDPKKGIQKFIDRSCSNLNLSLTALFPTCGTTTTAGTAACLNRKAACNTCMALNAANDLDRDCELFDDGLVNNTCACGNGVINAGESCDDGNNHSNDGCSFDCQIEIG